MAFIRTLFGAVLIFRRVGQVVGGWVDPDTPYHALRTDAYTKGDNRDYKLVFSDEFETDGRTFSDGEDPKWTALDKNDYTNEALHYYSSSNARTVNGVLNITTELTENKYKAFNEKTKRFYVASKHVQSSMIQGWNKFCITGGIVEFSAKLPGNGTTGGLWPAMWLLGNLARATYVGSSNWVWPFSYDRCDDAIRTSQEIDACRKIGHYGMLPGVGRGAPEIDIVEAMGGDPGPLLNTPVEKPYISSSFQVAPGVKKDRPVIAHLPKPGHWYDNLEYGNVMNTSINPYFYGITLVHEPKEYTYQSDAISANSQINESSFNTQKIYRIEWEPPEADNSGGYLRWYFDGHFIFGIKGESLKISGTSIPSEPMYLIMNTAVASTWGFPVPCPEGCACDCFDCNDPDCTCALPTGYCDNFPAYFEIDYVRVWQATDEPKHQVGCSTKDRPTELFIKGHKERYTEGSDKEPLEPIENGGAKCEYNIDCGGHRHGTCSSAGFCECNKGFTGPKCLAHEGFNDDSYEQQQKSIPVSTLMVPVGLVSALVVLTVGFCMTLAISVVLKHRDEDALYQQLERGNTNGLARGFNTDSRYPSNSNDTSYQNSGGPLQSSTNPQKVVTYCMIDGRLLDE